MLYIFYYEEEILSTIRVRLLSVLVKSLKRDEVSALSTTSVSIVSDVDYVGESKFCYQTKYCGRVYTTAVRELYYTLLAKQLPPVKIATTIESVQKKFLPLIAGC